MLQLQCATYHGRDADTRANHLYNNNIARVDFPWGGENQPVVGECNGRDFGCLCSERGVAMIAHRHLVNNHKCKKSVIEAKNER